MIWINYQIFERVENGVAGYIYIYIYYIYLSENLIGRNM